MLNKDLEPEFQNKLKIIAGKIRSTNFDKDNLGLYHATLNALFAKYIDWTDYADLLNKLEAYAEDGDPINFKLGLEMIEDVYL
jgi:hypothetical protein